MASPRFTPSAACWQLDACELQVTLFVQDHSWKTCLGVCRSTYRQVEQQVVDEQVEVLQCGLCWSRGPFKRELFQRGTAFSETH